MTGEIVLVGSGSVPILLVLALTQQDLPINGSGCLGPLSVEWAGCGFLFIFFFFMVVTWKAVCRGINLLCRTTDTHQYRTCGMSRSVLAAWFRWQPRRV